MKNKYSFYYYLVALFVVISFCLNADGDGSSGRRRSKDTQQHGRRPQKKDWHRENKTDDSKNVDQDSDSEHEDENDGTPSQAPFKKKKGGRNRRRDSQKTSSNADTVNAS